MTNIQRTVINNCQPHWTVLLPTYLQGIVRCDTGLGVYIQHSGYQVLKLQIVLCTMTCLALPPTSRATFLSTDDVM